MLMERGHIHPIIKMGKKLIPNIIEKSAHQNSIRQNILDWNLPRIAGIPKQQFNDKHYIHIYYIQFHSVEHSDF